MTWLPWTILAYGVLNIVMGLIGYLNKGSMVSLIAGGAAGLLIIAAAALARTHPRWGYFFAFVLALMLLGRFAGPFVRTQQIFPAGVMAAASLLMAGILVYAHFATPARIVPPADAVQGKR
jgi:uncharacterized membrane protein (UPF0136 family)